MEFKTVQLPQITILQEPVRGAGSTSSSLSWHLGQIVNATVKSTHQANGLTQLAIGGALISAKTDTSLTADETVNLKVVQLSTLPLAKALTVPVQQLSQAQNLLMATAPEAALKDWQTGQLLRATTLEQNTTGETLLSIQGRLLTVDATQLLSKNQSLTLRILALANPLLMHIEKPPGQQAEAASLLTPNLRLILPTALLRQLNPGDHLETLVTQATHQGKAVLSINGRAITAFTTLPLTEGQQIKLEISDLGKPPVLIPIKSIQPEEIFTTQLRNLLPQQTGLAELFSNLNAINSANPLTETLLQHLPQDVGKELRALAQHILQQLPRPNDLQGAQAIRQAILNSGVFLEQQLANSLLHQLPPSNNDLKANLLRLLVILQRQLNNLPAINAKGDSNNPPSSASRPPAPPMRDASPEAQARATATLLQHTGTQRMLEELVRQVSGNLARIQLHQLASLGREHDVARVVTVEIPVQHGQGTDVFHLRIDEQPSHSTGQQKERTWSISLAFELNELGPVHAKLTLGGTFINTTFWAEHHATKALIDGHLGQLQQSLSKAGLNPGQLTCHTGTPPQPARKTFKPSFIVDEKA